MPGAWFEWKCPGRQYRAVHLCSPGRLMPWADTHLTACSLALDAFHLAHQGQVEARAKAALQEERGAHAVEPPLGNDGDAVPQEVGLIHVVSGHDDGSACKGRVRGITRQATAGLHERRCTVTSALHRFKTGR